MRTILFFIFLASLTFCFCDELRLDNLTIKYQSKDSRIARELGSKLEEDIGKFQKQIGYYPQLETKVIIAEDREEYLTFLQSGIDIQEFSQAVYNRRTNTIYIRNPRDELNFASLSNILLHEYIHSFVFYYFDNAPLWFHEGMAVYFSNGYSHSRELGLVRDYLFGNTMPLSAMRSNYPKNRIEWESFYAKSALAVKYLFQNKPQQFYRLWQEALPYRKFNSAFVKSFRYSPLDFSIVFEEYCRNHFRSEIILALSGMIWLFFPIIFIIGYLKRQRNNRRKLAAMAEEEEKLTQASEIEHHENDIDEEGHL